MSQIGSTPAASNAWLRSSGLLAEAYQQRAQAAWNLRFELVTRAIEANLPSRPARIADIGGGYGRQALMLARLGHEVVVLDPDPAMLAAAAELAATEPKAVQDRLMLVEGFGENATQLIGGGFDLVCCHSVLMYLTDPDPLLAQLAQLAVPGALISVLALNAEAIAMRSGLQQRWAEALSTLRAGEQTGDNYLPCRADRRTDIVSRLTAVGATTRQWYGVGVFSDHLSESHKEKARDDIDTLLELEWLAGQRDPYRLLARNFHLMAERA